MHQGYIPCKQGMVHCELHYVQYAVNSGGKRASGIHTLQAGSGTVSIAQKHASVIRTLQAGNGTLRIPLCGKLNSGGGGGGGGKHASGIHVLQGQGTLSGVAGTSQRGRFRAEEAMEKRKDKGRWRRRKYA